MPEEVWRRDWRKYTKEGLQSSLQHNDWDIKCQNVEDYLDEQEHLIMRVFDGIVPLVRVVSKTNSIDPPLIEDMKWRRKNLFKNAKQR
jgi:hypothetical protein